MHACGWRTVLVLLLSSLVAAGTVTAAPITTLAVTEPGLTTVRALAEVGIARGIFEKYGLNIQLTAAATGLAGLQQAQGSAFLGAAAPVALCPTISQGAHLKAILVSNGDATGKVATDNLIAVVAGRASGIRAGHLEDLRGKRIGLTRRTITHQYFNDALAARGLDPLSAAAIVDTPTPSLPGALQNGAVDAVVAWEPVASQALEAASGSIVVQRGGAHIHFMQLRVVSARYLATHPGTIKRYVAAFAEAAQYVRAHRDDATGILLREFKGVGQAALQAAVGFLNPDVRVSKLTTRAWQEGCEFASKIGALQQAPTFEEVFDTRLLRQVEQEHPEFFGDLPPIPEALRL